MQAAFDKTDLIILKSLMHDGRASFSSIAKETALTDVAIKKRVESLRRRGIVSSITANLNYKALGFENPIFVQIRSEIGKNKDLIKKMENFDHIIELYQVLGEYNLLAKMVVNDLSAAEKVISKLGLIDGVLDVKALVVLNELKQGKVLPSTALQRKL